MEKILTLNLFLLIIKQKISEITEEEKLLIDDLEYYTRRILEVIEPIYLANQDIFRSNKVENIILFNSKNFFKIVILFSNNVIARYCIDDTSFSEIEILNLRRLTDCRETRDQAKLKGLLKESSEILVRDGVFDRIELY